MLRKLLFVLMTFAPPLTWAQTTIVFDHRRALLNEGGTIPSEEYFNITGELPQGVQLVRVALFKNSRSADKVLYDNVWQSFPGQQDPSFNVPFRYPLRAGQEYAFAIEYYRPVTAEENRLVARQLTEGLRAYINGTVQLSRGRIELAKGPRQMVREMDITVRDGLQHHRNRNGAQFPGFSDIVLQQLEKVAYTRLRKARFNVSGEDGNNRQDVRMRFGENLVEALTQMLVAEVNAYLGSGLMVIEESRMVVGQKTQQRSRTVAINAGYAATYLGDANNNLAYGGSPTAGLSFPLGNESFRGNFWTNSSISVGVMLLDMPLGDQVVSGPIVNRPFMVGYGYKFARILRAHAGVTVLQTKDSSAPKFDFTGIGVRPYIGLSMEVNLWLGFDRKPR